MSWVARIWAGVKSAFFDSIGLKIFSILAAIALYAIVHGAEELQRSEPVSVHVRLPPESSEMMLVSDVPSELIVVVRGTRTQLERIDSDAVVELNFENTAQRTFHVDTSAFEFPTGVHIESVSPDTISLRYARRIERFVQIEADVKGEVAEGFVVSGQATLDPAGVWVTGAEFAVNGLGTIRAAEELDVSGRTEELSRQLRLEDLPQFVEFRDQPLSSVGAVVAVTPEVRRRRAHLTVEPLNAPSGRARLRPSRVSVTLMGPSQAIDELDPERVIPFVDLSAIGSAAADVAVQIRGVPEGVEVAGIDPTHVLAIPR